MSDPDAEDNVIAAERIALGAMMLDPNAIDTVTNYVTSGDFYKPSHGAIYAAITSNHLKGDPVDPVAIADTVGPSALGRLGGAPYLHELTAAVPTTRNAGYYARIVAKAAAKRHLQEAHARVGVAIEQGDPDAVQLAQGELDIHIAVWKNGPWRPERSNGPDPLDWADLWARDFDDIDWLVEPLVERGQSVSIVGAAKSGKSLLTLELCAALAAGRPVLGNPAAEPVRVLYVDQENTAQDIYRRLSAMGYKPHDLGNLIYLSFANLPPLNTPTGAAALIAQVDRHEPEVIALDTISRMIVGKENDSDPWLELYRYTLVSLKSRRITTIRLDHFGKDESRGSRGSSAKQGDIDAEWELKPTGERRVELKRTLSRGANGDGELNLVRHVAPTLWHEAIGRAEVMRSDIRSTVANLDGLRLPLDVSSRAAAKALRDAGVGVSMQKILEAIRIRKERGMVVDASGASGDQKHSPTQDPVGSVSGDQKRLDVFAGQSASETPGSTQKHPPPSTWPERFPHTALHRSAGSSGPLADDDEQLDRWPVVPPPKETR